MPLYGFATTIRIFSIYQLRYLNGRKGTPTREKIATQAPGHGQSEGEIGQNQCGKNKSHNDFYFFRKKI